MSNDITPLEALQRIVEIAGSQSEAARQLGVPQPTFWKWLQSSKRLPAEYVLPAEELFGVSRHDLRPDLHPRGYGTDLFERYDGSRFLGIHDWMGDQRHLLEASGALSIVVNPPYSRQNGALVRGLAEKCIRRAIEVATHKVAALLPVKWLASKGRYNLFERDHRPSGIYILCERPSMPPGDVIEQLGKRAHDGGKVDFMWVVWDLQAELLPHAPTFWIPPRTAEAERVNEAA